MPGYTGIMSPSDLTPGRLRVELAQEIDKLNLDVNPLMMLLNEIGKESSGQMKFEWLTKERMSEWSSVYLFAGAWDAGAAVSGSFDILNEDAWKFAVGDIVKIPGTVAAPISDVNLYITAVGSANSGTSGAGYTKVSAHTFDNTTTVDFSAGTLGGSDPSVGSPSVNGLLHIGNTFELGTGMGTIKSHQPEENYNYIQIIQTPYGSLETTQHLNYDAGGSEMAENEEEAKIEHEFMKEKLAFFGQKYMAPAGYMNNKYPQYFTGGLLEAISTNVKTEADLTQAEFSQWVIDSIYYAKNPVIFAGDRIYQALSFWLGQDLNTRQDEDTLGIAVANYKTAHGHIVKVIPHRELFKEAYAGYAFCVDLDDIKYKYLEGEDTHIEVGIQPDDLKMEINELRTWFGIKIGNEKRHGVLKDVATISA